jgi:t-SNARE complex subunit (syntaxin)
MPKPTTTQRLDKVDRQLAAIRDMIQDGMRLVIQSRKDIRALNAAQIRLTSAQTRTDASLKALIDSLRTGGNGHSNGKTKH